MNLARLLERGVGAPALPLQTPRAIPAPGYVPYALLYPQLPGKLPNNLALAVCGGLTPH